MLVFSEVNLKGRGLQWGHYSVPQREIGIKKAQN